MVLLIAAVAQFGVRYTGNTHNIGLFMVLAFLVGLGATVVDSWGYTGA